MPRLHHSGMVARGLLPFTMAALLAGGVVAARAGRATAPAPGAAAPASAPTTPAPAPRPPAPTPVTPAPAPRVPAPAPAPTPATPASAPRVPASAPAPAPTPTPAAAAPPDAAKLAAALRRARFAAPPPPVRPGADFVGAEACGACHPAELAAWRRTDHAGASGPQVLGRATRSGACLVCHATGESRRTRARLPGVQCEACHGGGAAYATDDIMRDRHLSTLLGLDVPAADPDGATCRACHRDRAPTAGTRGHPGTSARGL